jgi:hypothetical protein
MSSSDISSGTIIDGGSSMMGETIIDGGYNEGAVSVESPMQTGAGCSTCGG